MTSSDHTITEQAGITDSEGKIYRDSVIYRMGPTPMHIAGPLIHGQREGLVKPSDVARWPGDDATFEQWQEYLAGLDQLASSSGAYESYAVHLKMDAVVIRCPWWCDGGHPEIVDGLESGVPHKSAACRLKPDENSGFWREGEFTVEVEEWHDPKEPGEFLHVRVPLDIADLSLTEEDARHLASMLTLAADRLAEIQRIDGAIADAAKATS